MPEQNITTPRKPRIAIAGATGRVGSGLTRLLASDPVDIVASQPGQTNAELGFASTKGRVYVRETWSEAPVQSFAAYRQKYAADPRVFSFDLQGYGTLQFPERQVYCVAGCSDKTMETLKHLDGDPKALLKQIEAIEL